MEPSGEMRARPALPDRPSAGLFDKIICAVKIEEESQKTRKILYGFIGVLLLSVGSMPMALVNFTQQWHQSGSGYFIYAAVENLPLFFSAWRDFTLSILESLPVVAMGLLALNMALVVFTVRLFLHRKGLLLQYIKHNAS